MSTIQNTQNSIQKFGRSAILTKSVAQRTTCATLNSRQYKKIYRSLKMLKILLNEALITNYGHTRQTRLASNKNFRFFRPGIKKLELVYFYSVE